MKVTNGSLLLPMNMQARRLRYSRSGEGGQCSPLRSRASFPASAIRLLRPRVLVTVLAFWMFPAASHPQASFTSGPYLQNVTGKSIVIYWESEPASDAMVEWWPEGSQTSSVLTDEEAQRHEIVLTELQSATPYRYRVRIPSQGEGTFFNGSFRTAPSGNAPFSFVMYGDSRTNHENHRAVAHAIRETDPAFVIHGGDIVTRGDSPEDWRAFWGVVAPPNGEESLAGNAPIFPVAGNHEYRTTLSGFADEAIVHFQSQFVLPENGLESQFPEWSERFYSFAYGPALFIVLDLNYDSDPDYDATGLITESGPPEIHPGSPQYEWLVSQLNAARDRYLFTFVCFHPPPYSSGPWGRSDSYRARFLDPLFRERGVDAVFTSHDHFYERSETFADGYRILYFVEGAGGASLYPRVNGWDEPGSWMWDESNQTFFTKAFDNATHSFIRVDITPLGGEMWQASFSAVRPSGEVFDVVAIRRPWRDIRLDEKCVFSFEAIGGRTYRVEYSDDVPAPGMNWQVLEESVFANTPFLYITDDGTKSGSSPADSSVRHRLYRVREVQ